MLCIVAADHVGGGVSAVRDTRARVQSTTLLSGVHHAPALSLALWWTLQGHHQPHSRRTAGL